jgi:hypothetical protein
MAHHRSNARNRRAKLDHHIVPFPTRNAPPESADMAAQSPRGQATGPRVRVRRCAAAQVTVLEVAGRLSDVADELDRAIQLALAGGPRGVVCDLTKTLTEAEPVAVGVVATAGRHVQDWPGIPVAVACPDSVVRQALRAHPLGGYLIVTESLPAAVAAVLETPYLMVQSLRLAAHPTAPRACREFLTRTLVDWRLSQVIPPASLVISELVVSSSTHAGTEIDISAVWDRGALRLTVADHGPALPGQPSPSLDLRGRGLSAVNGLSRSFGALPTYDGGQVLWAVLEAARP